MDEEKLTQNEHPPAPVIKRQSQYQALCDRHGIDRDVIATEIRKYIAEHPEAAKWPKDAIFGLAVTAHRLGLSLAPALGQAYILPSKNGCELIIGYRGLLKLAAQSGKVRGADAQVVRESDDFRLKLAGESYDVEWAADASGLAEPGRIVGAFARVFLEDAPTIVAVLRMDAILEIRERKGPQWQKDPEAMVKKTVLSRALRLVPGLDTDLATLAGGDS